MEVTENGWLMLVAASLVAFLLQSEPKVFGVATTEVVAVLAAFVAQMPGVWPLVGTAFLEEESATVVVLRAP